MKAVPLLSEALDILAAHRFSLLLPAIAIYGASSFLSHRNLLRMRGMTRRRRAPLILISGAVAGLSTWTAQFGLVASFFGTFHQGFDGTVAALQIAACVVLYVLLSASSQWPFRRVHQTSLFLLPIIPGCLNYWMVATMTDLQAISSSGLFYAFLFLGVLGLMLAMTARDDGDDTYAPLVPFVVIMMVQAVLAHVVLLTAYAVDPAVYAAFSRDDLAGQNFSMAAVLLPVGIANLLVLAVGGANFSMDVAASREALDRYRKLAMEDGLTGLPNRSSLMSSLATLLSKPDKDPCFALAIIDLDRFKAVNDQHGHAAGDALLSGLSAFIVEGLEPDATLYRLGGDEFIALKTGVKDRAEAVQFGEHIRDLVKRYDNPVTGQIKVGASIGVSLYPEDGQDQHSLLLHADSAMYRAKNSGRDQVCGFDARLDLYTAKAG